MEAERVRPQNDQIDEQVPDREELPPPPAPFPTELITSSELDSQTQVSPCML